MHCQLDLTIAEFIGLAARPLEEADLAWGEGNCLQGLVWHESLVMMDPLADEEFGADVTVRLAEKFLPNRTAQRCLQMPFRVPEGAALLLFSAEDEEAVPLDVAAGDYTLFYEVCLSREVFYVLTLVREAIPHASARKSDGWGMEKDKPLVPGVF